VRSQEISDLTAITHSVPQWCHVLASKSGELDAMIQASTRGASLTGEEVKAVENLCGHLQIAIGVFQDLIGLAEATTGRALPEDWKSRRIS
jgi:hypothetical protein